MTYDYITWRGDYLENGCVGQVEVEYQVLRQFLCWYKVRITKTARDGEAAKLHVNGKTFWMTAFPWSGFSNYRGCAMDETLLEKENMPDVPAFAFGKATTWLRPLPTMGEPIKLGSFEDLKDRKALLHQIRLRDKEIENLKDLASRARVVILAIKKHIPFPESDGDWLIGLKDEMVDTSRDIEAACKEPDGEPPQAS